MRAEAARGLVLVAVVAAGVVVVRVVVVVVLLRRETRRYGTQRASRGQAGGGRQQQVETAAAGSAGFVPLVSQACAVPCVQGCATVPVSSLGLGSQLAVGAGSRGGWAGAERDETRRDEGRTSGGRSAGGERHKARGTRRDRVGSSSVW